MAKTWVLDTETKGTGAHVAPLRAGKPAAKDGDSKLAVVQLARPPRERPADSDTPQPLRFKLVDVRAAQVLGEGLDTRATVDELARMDSSLDARVYVWEQARERWQLLGLADTRALWRLARRERERSTQTIGSTRA